MFTKALARPRIRRENPPLGGRGLMSFSSMAASRHDRRINGLLHLRMNPSSSDSAKAIAWSTDLPDWVHWAMEVT